MTGLLNPIEVAFLRKQNEALRERVFKLLKDVETAKAQADRYMRESEVLKRDFLRLQEDIQILRKTYGPPLGTE